MFYERFAVLCQERGVSPSAVVVEIGLSKPNAVYWKQGSVPKGKTLQKLTNYFAVSVDYLLNGGSKVNPLSPSRRIFSVMYEQNYSLEKLSQETGISIETIRSFALGEQVEDGRNCLEKIANELDVEPAYLMGWTNYPMDDAGYWDITKEMWEACSNEPVAAYGMQRALEPTNYEYEMVWDALKDAGFVIKSAGFGDGHSPDGDMYYIWHEDAEELDEDRVQLPFREILHIVRIVQQDAERRRKTYLRNRFDAEWF